jgi:ATP-binding cassette subfamily C (CFTR/MRP) protein 1
MDSTLSQSLAQFTGCIAVLICNIIVIAIATKWFAIAIPPIAVVYYFIQR